MGTAIEKHHTFKGIAGLKVIAALFMFLWHSPITHPPVDLGARLCEFFFVTSGFLFAVVFIIRYALEAIPVYYPGQFWTINAHVSPLVRALEFGLGMITASFFLTFPATLKNRITFVVSTLLEISSLVMIVVILIQMEGRWLRAAYVIPFCILIACFAFDGGLISKLFAVKPIQWLSNFQLEIYMLHQLCFRYVEYRYPLPVQMAIYTCALIMAIFVYRAFLQKILEQILSGVQGKLARHQTSTQISKD